jgi:hypothetical protein
LIRVSFAIDFVGGSTGLSPSSSAHAELHPAHCCHTSPATVCISHANVLPKVLVSLLFIFFLLRLCFLENCSCNVVIKTSPKSHVVAWGHSCLQSSFIDVDVV